MLITPIQFGLFAFILALFQKVSHLCLLLLSKFGLFCIYSSLIFRKLVIYACYFYPIWLILHLFFPYFLVVPYLFFFLLSNFVYFAFILSLFLVCHSSILFTPIQFGLFCIYSCLIFSGSVIYACYSYPIWLILHLSLPYI